MAMMMHHVTMLKSSQNGHPVTRSESYSVPWGCGRMGGSQHESAADKSAAVMYCSHVNMDQRLKGTHCGIHRHEDWRLF